MHDYRFSSSTAVEGPASETAPALNDGGTFTETRTTPFTAAVHEVQVVN
ncbi:hypothetical protein [[Kitasatospora] papulosa]